MGKPFIYHEYRIPAVVESAPTLQSAVIDTNGTTLILTFDKAVTITNTNGFVFAPYDQQATIVLSSGSGTNTILCTINRTIYNDDSALLSYVSSEGNVLDGVGNSLATFSSTVVTNNSTEVNPDPFTPFAPETFNTDYDLPVGGTTYTPADSTELTSALSTAVGGDVIVLTAGVTYTGNFKLRNWGEGEDWIYIISSALASLPAEGIRIGPSDVANMPTLTSSSNAPLHSAFGAHHYRLVGIRVITEARDALATVQFSYDGDFNTNAENLSDLPHHITLDRMLISSTSDAHKLRHGVMFNGSYMACVDSYINNVKDGADAQAVWVWNGPGPYKIVNNFLEATGENFMSGGTDPQIAELVPSDIEFRGNYLFKRLSWKTVPTPNWNIKNLFELKNAKRVLVVGNVMENNWTDGQAGMALLITPRNQNDTAPWSVVRDVNIHNNVITNVGQGMGMTAEDDVRDSQQTKRVRIVNNVIKEVTSDYSTGPVFFSMATPDVPLLNLTITHNTCLSPTDESGCSNHISIGINGPVDGCVIQNNIIMHGSYHPNWVELSNATHSYNLIGMIPANFRYAENVANFTTRHPGDLMANPGFTGIGFVDLSGGNLRLDASSMFKGSGLSGVDPGCNIDELELAITGTINGSGLAIIQSLMIPTGGDTLTVGFSRNVNLTNSSGFSVEFDNLASRTLTYASGNGSTGIVFTIEPVSLSTDGRAPIGTECLLSYNSSVGNVSNLANITGQVVTNNSIIIPEPDLPQNLPVTTLPSGWTGTATYTPTTMAALNALTSATGGLVAGNIVQLSGTYSGLWTIDAACKGTLDNPIVFRTANYTGLPAYGTRVSSGHISSLATITRVPFQASSYTLKIDKGSGTVGAGHLRFIGLQFHSSGTYNNLSNIIDIGELNHSRDTSELPSGIGFNHCLVTCSDGIEVNEAMRIDAVQSFVVDSSFTNLDAGGNDGSTAIRFYVGSGMVFNNLFIESESAAIFLGGNEQNRVDDVYIGHVYNTRPTGWEDGNGIQKAGLLETKAGLRVLIENCYTENAVWQQGGFAALTIKSEATQTGTYKTTRHFTARNIEINNCDMGAYPHVAGSSATGQYGGNSDMLFENLNVYNVTTAFQLAPYKTSGLISGTTYDGLTQQLQRLTIRHNTFIGGGLIVGGVTDGTTPGNYHVFDDNICSGTYGYNVNNGQQGAWALNWGWGSGYKVRKNAFVGQSSSMYDTDVSPAPSGILSGSYFPTVATCGFADEPNDDYRIISGVLQTGATDGTMVGCDVAALNAIISGVFSGIV